MVLVLMRYGIIGIGIEMFGFLNLFGNFLPTVLTVARQIPGLAYVLDLPGVSQLANFITGSTKPRYSV
jgi:hypothetical protein